MNWLSFQQAILDLNIELWLTVILVFMLFGFGLMIGRWSLRRELASAKYHEKDIKRNAWWNNFLQGISTELFGAFFTTIGFGLILVVFQQYQIVQNDKADIVLQMGSRNNTFTTEAIRIARQKGWLEDGTLVGVDLFQSNLQDGELWGTNLQSANLTHVNLVGADATRIILQDANLFEADLKYASLLDANLKQADLLAADLYQAYLYRSNLEGANLIGANLKRADLREAKLRGAIIDSSTEFDSLTALPDATRIGTGVNGEPIYDIFWTPDTDMFRYTDPNHPDFWQPDWAKSDDTD